MKNSRCAAFTLWEALALTAAILILLVLFLPKVSESRVSSTQILCIYNLKQVALGLNTWIHDNETVNVPWQMPVANGGTKESNRNAYAWTEYYHIRKGLATPRILTCPTDKARLKQQAKNWDQFKSTGFMNNSVSYFLNLDAGFASNMSIERTQKQALAGDRNIMTEGRAASCSTGVNQPWIIRPATANVLWTNNPSLHKNRGDLAILDGSVEMVGSEQLREIMRRTDDDGSVHLLLP